MSPSAASPDPLVLPMVAHRAAPRVGVIYNPRSHRNRGQDLDCALVPLISVAQPGDLAAIRPALEDFARQGIDLLVINGGDGTVRDVLTCGQAVFGDSWPALAVLPKGKTNALNVDLGAPANWTLAEAVMAYAGGRRITRRPVAISPAAGGDPLLGFILGGGAYSTGIRAGQDAHRIGAFNSLAVGVTALWGVLQGLFGTDANRWRRGTRMQLLLGPERQPLPRSGFGDPARRCVMLASTLARFPLGMKLFGPERAGLKLGVLDHPRRRLLLVMPAILAGKVPRWVAQGGFWQLDTEGFELEIEEPYILDGEAYPAGHYRVTSGPELSFVVP